MSNKTYKCVISFHHLCSSYYCTDGEDCKILVLFESPRAVTIFRQTYGKETWTSNFAYGGRTAFSRRRQTLDGIPSFCRGQKHVLLTSYTEYQGEHRNVFVDCFFFNQRIHFDARRFRPCTYVRCSSNLV